MQRKSLTSLRPRRTLCSMSFKFMSPKVATCRLYVILVSFFTAVLALASAIITLVTALVRGLTNALETLKPYRASEAQVHLFEGPAVAPGCKPRKPKRPNLRVVRATPTNAEQVAFALCHMGYRPTDVQSVLLTLGCKIETSPIVDSIKEALKLLTLEKTG